MVEWFSGVSVSGEFADFQHARPLSRVGGFFLFVTPGNVMLFLGSAVKWPLGTNGVERFNSMAEPALALGGLSGGNGKKSLRGGPWRIPKKLIFICVLHCFLHRGCPKNALNFKRAPGASKSSKNGAQKGAKMASRWPMWEPR